MNYQGTEHAKGQITRRKDHYTREELNLQQLALLQTVQRVKELQGSMKSHDN